MSNSITTTQKELLNTQNNVAETGNSKDSTMTGKLAGSPINWVRKDDGLHIALGKYRLNEQPIPIWVDPATDEPEEDEAAAEDYVKRNMWDIILKIVMIATSDVIEASKRQEDTKKL